MSKDKPVAAGLASVAATVAETVIDDLAAGDDTKAILKDVAEAAFKRLVWLVGGHPKHAVGAIVTLPVAEADVATDAREARPASEQEIAHHLGNA